MESRFVQKLREDRDYFDRFTLALQNHARTMFRNHLRFSRKGEEWSQYRSYLRCLKYESFRRLSAATLDEIAARFEGRDFDSLCASLLGPTIGDRDVAAHDRATPAQHQWRKETKLLISPRYATHAALLWSFVRGDNRSPGAIPHPNALATVFQARRRKIRDDEKMQSLIIEQAFVTTVRPVSEVKAFSSLDGQTVSRLPLPRHMLRIGREGHSVSKGASVLQCMSEDFPPFSNLGDYFSQLYCEEVEFTTEDPVGIRFLGIVSNNHRGIRYLFFVFEVSISDAVSLRLKVDREDVAVWQEKSNYAALFNRVAANKTDVVVLRDLMQLRLPPDVECGHARAIYRGYPGDVVSDVSSQGIEIDRNSLSRVGIDDWMPDQES